MPGIGEMLMNKKKKKAYLKGREEGFDKGFSVAKMVYEQIAVYLRLQIEELNSQIILGEEEDDEHTD